MAASKFYRQCTLQSGNTQTTGWIEERGAKQGWLITLEDDETPGRWWTVMQVGETRMSDLEVRDRERDYLHQRRASDIMRGER